MPHTPSSATGDLPTARTLDAPVVASNGSSPAETRRAALSSFVGTTVEFYDFLLYGAASALVFNKIFFGSLSPSWATAASFATFAAGYVARLAGGLVFAHYGDRTGRKSVLVVTMLMMGVATGLMGLLPTYAQIGAAAPALLVVLRVVQGLAAGGEYGGAALMAAEHAPRERRGLVGSATSLGIPFGGILGTGVFAVVATMPEDEFLSWGWRIPFLIGFVLVGIGLWIRLKVSETPAFEAARTTATDESRQFPLATLLRRRPGAVLRGVLLAMPSHAIASLFGAYLLSYAVSVGYTASQGLVAVILGGAVAVVLTPLWAALSDRVGRRPVFLFGAASTAVLAYPAIALVNSGSNLGLIGAQLLIGSLASTALAGPMVAMLSEMFDTDVRYTGVAMTYQTATVIAGGFAPLIAAVLAASGVVGGGNIAFMLVILSVAAVIAILFSPESRGSDLTQPAGS